METLEVLVTNGLRLLLVGYESGSQQILNRVKKGIKVDRARRFAKDCVELGVNAMAPSSSVCLVRPRRR